MSYFSSKALLIAKSLAAKDWSNPKVLLVARHMAHDGKSIDEIKDTLGWDITHERARYRLRKFNIYPLPKKNRRAHRGFNTTLNGCASGINQQSFKSARAVR